MSERKKSEFHSCICSKLEKLTITGADGQPWRSISVSINFGDYEKVFKIDMKDLPLPTEIGNVAENAGNPVEPEEPQNKNNNNQQSETAMNIPIVPSSSNQNSNHHLPTRSASRTKNRAKVKILSNQTATSSTRKNLHECTTCGKQLSNKNKLIVHQKMMHSDEQTKANWKHECDICSKKFPYLPFLKTHKLVHSKQRKFKCPHCPAAFKQKGHLRRHFKTHAKDSPFRCKICDKVLSSSDSLDAHIRTHTGEKPYQCQICDESFAKNCRLKIHMQREHSP